MRPHLHIVIPCYNEERIVESISSVAQCTPINNPIHITVVVNNSEHTEDTVRKQNNTSIDELTGLQKQLPDWITLDWIKLLNVPSKIAGVGNARKAGMDYAYNLSNNKKESVIVCYDADCTVSINYLQSIENTFRDSTIDGATIYFEHPFAEENKAIVDYELFLRHHYLGLRYTGYPYAYQTIGSSMAVRADTYKSFGE